MFVYIFISVIIIINFDDFITKCIFFKYIAYNLNVDVRVFFITVAATYITTVPANMEALYC